MATDVSSMPGINGYAPHQGYGSLEHAQANPYAQSSTPASAASMYDQPAAHRPQEQPTAAAPQQPHSDVPKDEVGWYFVEQYYTTLSRSPEKLYLFYNKRSQFVSGQETDKVPVCVGQRAINDRIKELDFQDCKVRVTNVDSQASDSNIVIQVIGEMSNKGQPHKKFAQTFVLAAQTNGYFVLNDIFRYLIEEEEEGAPEPEQQPQLEEIQQVPAAESSGVQEPPATAQESAHETLTSSTDPVAVERDAEEVDRELEEKVLKADEPEAAHVNGDSSAETEEANHVDETSAAPAVTEPEEKENAEPAVAEAALKPEKPKDPSPSPAATPATETPAQSAPAPKPAVPKTWASLAASANRVATPQAPQQAPAQPRPAPVSKPQSSSSTAQASAATSTPPAATTPSAPSSQREESAPSAAQDEWTAVPSSHNRQQSRQAATFQSDQSSLGRGYIKNVTEAVSHEELRSKMEQYGELLYFDISRAKNSAFVDFKSPDSYRAAVAANPHTVGSERLLVEPRRVNPNGPQGIGRGGPYQRGGAPRGGYRGRGDFAGGRGGRGGAGNGAPRGRGGAQQGGT